MPIPRGRPNHDPALWEKIRRLADRFHQADRIVVGVPMWNWAYPYKLKQLIDLVTQRGLLFEVDGDTIGPSLDVPLGIAFLVREVRTLIVDHTWDDLAGPAIEWGRAQARSMATDF